MIPPNVGTDHVAQEVRPLLDAVRRTPDGVYMCAPISRRDAICLLEYVQKLEEKNVQPNGR